jgi:hypothetical protein
LVKFLITLLNKGLIVELVSINKLIIILNIKVYKDGNVLVHIANNILVTFINYIYFLVNIIRVVAIIKAYILLVKELYNLLFRLI